MPPKSSLELARELLASGIDVNSLLAGNVNGIDIKPVTLLCLVIEYADSQSLECVRFLLDAGADPELACEQGMFPLYYAAKYGQHQIGKLLLAYGANPARTYQGDKLGNIAFTYENTNINRSERLSAILPHTGLFNKKIEAHTQTELLALSTALGYKTKKRGICYAVAMMTIQAINFEDGLDTFEKRFARIYNHSTEQLLEFISAAKKKRQRLYLAAKMKYSHAYLNATENTIDAELKCKKDTQLSFQKKLAKLIRIKANAEVMSILTETEKIDLEIEAFFDGIEVHQNSYHKNVKDFVIKRNIASGDEYVNLLNHRVFAITDSHEMDDDLAYICQTNGIYSYEEVQLYFRSLREILRKHYESIKNQNISSFMPPFSMKLSGNNHAISVAYDFQKDEWLFADVNIFKNDHQRNQPIIRRFKNESDLANNILWSFRSDINSYVAFSSAFYTTSDQSTVADEYINTWKKTAAYKQLHAITQEHAVRRTKQNNDWQSIALRDYDASTLSKLDGVNATSKQKALLEASGLFFSAGIVQTIVFASLGGAFLSFCPIVAAMYLGAILILLGAFGISKLISCHAKKTATAPEIANPANEEDQESIYTQVLPVVNTRKRSILPQKIYKASTISIFAGNKSHAASLHLNTNTSIQQRPHKSF